MIARAAGFGDDTAAYRASLDADPANTPETKDELVARATEDIERAMAIAPRFFGVLPKAPLRRPPGRGVQGEGRAVRLLLPAGARRLAAGDLLRQRLRPAQPQVHQAGHDDLPRGRSGPPLPDHPRDGEPAPQHVPPPRGTDGRWRVRRGLGPLQRAAGRRDGPLPRRGGALRDARRAGLAGRPAGRRHGSPRAALAAPAVDRFPQGGRPVRHRRGDRDRPLHLLAGPGADLQDRPARDRAAAGRALGTRRLGVRPARVPRRRAGPRIAARSRRSAASCRTGWPPRSDPGPGPRRSRDRRPRFGGAFVCPFVSRSRASPTCAIRVIGAPSGR